MAWGRQGHRKTQRRKLDRLSGRLGGWLALLGLGLMPLALGAQAPADSSAPAPADTSRATPPGDSPVAAQDTPRADTADTAQGRRRGRIKAGAEDSAAIDTSRNVVPHTGRLNLARLHAGMPPLDSLSWRLGPLPRWDETDTVTDGFGYSLGQVGKPFQRWRYGLPARWLPSDQYRSPITGRRMPYVLNPARQLPTYNSRTFYVVADYAQSRRATQSLRVNAAFNPNPFWNITLHYRRRVAEGPYLHNATDHYNLGIGSYFHTLDNRYQAYYALSFNELIDNMNGGVRNDGTKPFAEQFDKVQEATVFQGPNQTQSNALWTRRVRSAYTFQRFYILNDSLLKLAAEGAYRYDEHARLFQLSSNVFLDSVPPPSGPFGSFYSQDTLPLDEHLKAWRRHYRAGGHLVLQPGPVRWFLRGEYHLVQRNFEPEHLSQRSQVSNRIRLEGRLGLDLWGASHLAAEATLQRGQHTLFEPTSLLAVSGRLHFARDSFRLRDSSVIDTGAAFLQDQVLAPYVHEGAYAPFQLRFNSRFQSRHPSMFQRYWDGLTFQGDPSLANSQLNLIEGAARWRGPPGVDRGLPYLQDFAAARAGVARLAAPIYYDERARVRQSGASSNLVYPRLQLAFRKRFWRIYLQNRTTYLEQQGSAGAPSVRQGHLPNFYGTAELFYRDMWFGRRARVRIGLAARYHTGYDGYRFDPATQVFYPLPGYETRAYTRLDLSLSAKIQRARIFLKLRHLNEGLLAPGYYTTFFYPMQERAFTFGVIWRFYD